MSEAVFFYLFTVPMLLAALTVILHRQPIYCVLALLAVMFCLAALFIMLQAYVVAALQVLLYAGAVLVLFLFIIMLLNLEPEALSRLKLFTLRTAGTLIALCFLALLLPILRSGPSSSSTTGWAGGTIEAIGRVLFRDYLLPFEVTSFIVLAAIIAAVTLAKQESRNR